MSVLSLHESVETATEVFRTFANGSPELIKTGIGAVDKTIGGLFAGTAGIIGAATGVGKSSLVLHGALNNARSGLATAVISCEDTADVFGSRALAEESGVNSLKIRRKSLSQEETQRLREASERLREYPVHVAYEVGSGLDRIVQSMEVLADKGCKMLFMDYIQKVRGVSEDRRSEVGRVFYTIQGRASELGMAVLFVSQFSRQDPTEVPKIWWLKESGDLENEARIILLMHRDSSGFLHGRLAKSTFGGEGAKFLMYRDEAGVLKEKRLEEF